MQSYFNTSTDFFFPFLPKFGAHWLRLALHICVACLSNLGPNDGFSGR